MTQLSARPVLDFLLAGKTGSSALQSFMGMTQRANPQGCAGLQVHFHTTLARTLPAGNVSVTVLRDPCERFLSIFDHIKSYNCTDGGCYVCKNCGFWWMARSLGCRDEV